MENTISGQTAVAANPLVWVLSRPVTFTAVSSSSPILEWPHTLHNYCSQNFFATVPSEGLRDDMTRSARLMSIVLKQKTADVGVRRLRV